MLQPDYLIDQALQDTLETMQEIVSQEHSVAGYSAKSLTSLRLLTTVALLT